MKQTDHQEIFQVTASSLVDILKILRKIQILLTASSALLFLIGFLILFTFFLSPG